MSLETIVRRAITIRRSHFKVGRPMRASEGFRESNIAHDLSASFRNARYYVFPEFPFKRGSIDAVFVRDSHLVLCEWKRLYRRSIPKIHDQTKRLLSFNPEEEMGKHMFTQKAWKVSHLWVCDTWEKRCVDWWNRSQSSLGEPFDAAWKVGHDRFIDFDKDEWDHYHWLWAIHG